MITITDTDLEMILKSLLQQKAEFIIHKKVWRSGRILLFKQNGFFIEFIIKNNKEKTERFEIPIPFDITQKRNLIRLSYELTALVCNDEETIDEIKKIEPNCRSKYFNSYLEIRTL
ncbi:MAG: hypothetical protein WC905_01655 [Patescibacteria group bacterium]|jgi:hypothetical protein